MQFQVRLRLKEYSQREVTDFKYVGDYSKRGFKKIHLLGILTQVFTILLCHCKYI